MEGIIRKAKTANSIYKVIAENRCGLQPYTTHWLYLPQQYLLIWPPGTSFRKGSTTNKD